MDLIQALILGIVQGITEFLPISSTAHLILVPWFFGWKDPGLTFDLALHVGTFLSVAWFFWGDIRQMAAAWLSSFRKPNFAGDPYQRLAWMVFVGCIPAGVAGLAFKESIETTLRSPYIIAGMLIGVALLLLLGEFVGKRFRNEKELLWRDALLIGLAQAIALIPGTSRSGSTMTMGLFLGLTREAAARFSFLLGLPITFAACVFQLKDLVGQQVDWLPFIGGTVASTVTGYFCIKFLLAFLAKQSMAVFIAYRLILGGIILALLLTGTFSPTIATH